MKYRHQLFYGFIFTLCIFSLGAIYYTTYVSKLFYQFTADDTAPDLLTPYLNPEQQLGTQ